jgi:hypothetical protein
LRTQIIKEAWPLFERSILDVSLDWEQAVFAYQWTKLKDCDQKRREVDECNPYSAPLYHGQPIFPLVVSPNLEQLYPEPPHFLMLRPKEQLQ